MLQKKDDAEAICTETWTPNISDVPLEMGSLKSCFAGSVDHIAGVRHVISREGFPSKREFSRRNPLKTTLVQFELVTTWRNLSRCTWLVGSENENRCSKYIPAVKCHKVLLCYQPRCFTSRLETSSSQVEQVRRAGSFCCIAMQETAWQSLVGVS